MLVKRSTSLISAVLAVCFAVATANAGELVNKDESDLAIKGYDAVAYFTMRRPVAGRPDITYVWHDATWQFASAKHRDLFAGNPRRYAPRYGGFCAGAMAQGMKVPVDPKAWVIIDDKLYLSYQKRFIREFAEDAPRNIAKADENWKRIGRTP
jgi:hypothetical protein